MPVSEEKTRKMIANVIDNIEEFEKLKDNWDAVYQGDPNTTIFISWQWMLGWIKAWTGYTTEELSYDWQVIGIKPDAHTPYVAFMPISTKTIKKLAFKGALNFHVRTFHMGGNPWSDYTGFVCLPEYDEKAIPMFANYIQKHVKADIFEIKNVFDPRIDLFLKCFSQKKFTIRESEPYRCPHIILPDSWDKYLEEFLSAATRRSLKYDTRKLQSLDEFRVTHVEPENVETQIETLLSLYLIRWGHKSEADLNRFRSIFKSCFENNSLWLDILWEGSVPIAGFAVFLDHKIKSFTTYTIVSNKKYAKRSPGSVMVGYSIRYAIENGFRIFDLGTGDEPYKFSFGATERFSRNIIINKDFNIKLKSFIYNINERVPVKLKSLVKTILFRSIQKSK